VLEEFVLTRSSTAMMAIHAPRISARMEFARIARKYALMPMPALLTPVLEERAYTSRLTVMMATNVQRTIVSTDYARMF